MNPSDGIKQAWQASAGEAEPPKLEQVRDSADRLYRKVRRRNALEYGASIAVVLIFSAYALFLPEPTVRLGALLVVLGTFVMVWQFHRRASAVTPPDASAAQPILVHQRAQLARQRDALASIFTWYLSPFLPGLFVMMFAPALDRGPAALCGLGLGYWLATGTVILVFAVIWWLNRLAARSLKQQVEAIDTLLDEGR